jgi:predicted nuclease with TOPRIM domain|tara:strand:+ start:566 stop:1069 length:504 start_codon:yes stop_codon:yes gene_type:complete
MSEETTIEPDVKQENVTQGENNVPISRLNEVISERNELREMLESFKSKEEESKRAKLQEEEKWQELNAELVKQLDSYKPYKDRWDSMDKRLREGALAQLPESKREKFANVDTEVLLNIVEEFTEKEKVNPPDTKGTIPTEKIGDWTEMSSEDRRKNWGTILESYVKR